MIARSLLRLLLRLYPRPFRERFATEMCDVFVDRCEDIRDRRGTRGVVVLWARTCASVTVAALAQRLGGAPSPARRSGPSRAQRGRGSHERGGAGSPSASEETPRPSSRSASAGGPAGPPLAPSGSPKTSAIMDRFVQDLRYAARLLVRSPGFTAAAVVTLALGIGANTAAFSLVNALLIRPLPAIPDQDRLVAMFSGYGDALGVSSYVTYKDIRDRNRVFDGLAVYKPLSMDLSHEGFTERIEGLIVSGNYFSTLRLTPAFGRFITPREDRVPDGEPWVVLSYGLWERQFGADPGIVGREILLNGRAFTVLGVAPEGFRGTVQFRADAFAPMMMQPHFMPASGNLLDRRGWGGVLVVGRLRDGITLEQARADLASIVAWLQEEYPRFTSGVEYRLVSFQEATIMPSVRSIVVRFSWLVMAIMALVLVIACVNVANLLLARADGRRHEIAVRQALGAGRGRLLRQLLVESVLLGGLGGVAGLLLAVWAGQFLSTLPFPFVLEFGLDTRILGFTLAVSLATGVLFGIVPALQATRRGPSQQMRERAATATGGRLRLGNLLVVGQVSLSLLLLVSAGLFVRSLANLRDTELGFDPRGVLVGTVDPGLQGYEGVELARFYDRLIADLRAIPGVVSASSVSLLPGPYNDDVTTFEVEGYTPPTEADVPLANFNYVGPDYFRTMRVPIVAGRGFTETDTSGSMPVLVVNEMGAALLEQLTGRPALGQRLGPDPDQLFEVVGVAADSKVFGLQNEGKPLAYLYYPQVAAGGGAFTAMSLLVRTEGDPLVVAPVLRDRVGRIDANVPLLDVESMQRHLAETLLPERYSATALTVAAGLALLLAAVGLHGVLAYSVSRRTRELGVRIALGADREAVLRLVVGQGMTLVGVGMVIGLAASLGTTRLLAGFLYEVAPFDPVTYLGGSVVLGAVGVLATWLPARRATHVDPLTALRSG